MTDEPGRQHGPHRSSQHGQDRRPRPDRRKLDEVFGDVLPDTTTDERDPAPSGRDDDWYLANRPPHHDRD